MATRTAAEKEKIEKRMRAERIIVPIVCAAAIAAFIILCAVFGKDKASGVSANASETPAPTEEPCFELIKRMAGSFNAEVIEGERSASLSFKSEVDNNFVTVKSYDKDGVVCLQIARKLEFIKSFDGLFVEPDEVDRSAQRREEYAEELCSLLVFLNGSDTEPDLKNDIMTALASFQEGKASKASVVMGVYVVTMSYSKTDGMMKVVCEQL